MTPDNNHVLRIILVDDDKDDQEFFAEAVSKVGIPYELKTADSCTELIKQIEIDKECFDIIFLDINMPIMNGIQCLEALKSSEICKHVPVIIFSMTDSAKEVEIVYDLGAHYHIVKPYAQINLIATLKIIFGLNWKVQQPIPPRDKFLINLTFNS